MEITVTVRLDGESGEHVATVTAPAAPASLHRPGAVADLGPLGRLTPAELRVLRLVAAGLEYKEAARILGLSEPTIRTHMRTITSKMDVINGRMAGALALVNGILTADDIIEVWAQHRADMLAEGK